mgnify:CR=1 FL=1
MSLCAPIVPLCDTTFLQMTRLLQVTSTMLVGWWSPSGPRPGGNPGRLRQRVLSWGIVLRCSRGSPWGSSTERGDDARFDVLVAKTDILELARDICREATLSAMCRVPAGAEPRESSSSCPSLSSSSPRFAFVFVPAILILLFFFLFVVPFLPRAARRAQHVWTGHRA